ncbi:MAG: hypothetical protein JNN27_13540 [Planctomycetes bacterium]|nr:hypothetical protein [Planctomycetota bacterium]
MEALAENHLRAVADFVGRASVPLFARGAPGQLRWVTRGTAAWLRVPQPNGASRLFLLTAAHVVFGADASTVGELWVPVSRPSAELGTDTFLLSNIGVATFTEFDDKHSPDTDHMDSVVIEVRDRVLIERVLAGGWEILDVDNIGPNAASSEIEGIGYLVCGYPAQLNVSAADWVANAPVHLLVSRYDGEVNLTEGYDPNVDLMLERPNRYLETNEPLETLPLQGMSGALVWAIRAGNVPGVWHPRRGVVIAGHQVSATPTGYIRARRGIALARLLQRTAPEIAPQVEARLDGRVVD